MKISRGNHIDKLVKNTRHHCLQSSVVQHCVGKSKCVERDTSWHQQHVSQLCGDRKQPINNESEFEWGGGNRRHLWN